MRSRRDPPSGGFYSQSPTVTTALSMDSASTSLAGLAALTMGDLPVADGAARFLGRLLERQPERGAFYTHVSTDGHLVTDVAPGERTRRISVTKNDQAWYFLGLPTIFLPALYEASGDPAHLALGLRYLEYLAVECCAAARTDPSSGKSGVGAAHLYRLTGDERHRDFALEVADSIMRWQDPHGCWRWRATDGHSAALEPADVDLTAEHVIWLHKIRGHLAR